MALELIDLVDSHYYAKTNCFQRQVTLALQQEFNVTHVELNELHQLPTLPASARVISRLRLRTLVSQAAAVQRFVGNARLAVYDEDAWCNFIVGDPFYGCYNRLTDVLSPVGFIVQSKFWADRCRDAGFRAEPYRLWAVPEAASQGKPWSSRSHNVVFSGTLKPWRARFFDELRDHGVGVEIHSMLGHDAYLELLRDSKLTIRSEARNWLCNFKGDFVKLPHPNALWNRDVEAASQGCFSLRQADDTFNDEELHGSPLVRPWFGGGPREVAQLVNDVLNFSDDYHATAVQASRGFFASADGLRTTLARAVNGLLQ